MNPPIAQAAPFVHPTLAAAGLVAGLLPILIHLINRTRHRRVPWAAMHFLLTASKKSTQTMRIEQWLLLAVRVLLVVTFGLAIARPFFAGASSSFVGVSRAHHVILIDNSRSMNALKDENLTRFAQAKQLAEGLVSQLPESDVVSLITLAFPATAVIHSPSYDRLAVHETLGNIAPTQQATDTLGALTLAEKIITDSDTPRAGRMLTLISDMPTVDWLSSDGQRLPPAAAKLIELNDQARINIHNVAGSGSENLAIVDIRPESNLIGASEPIRIAVPVRNYGASNGRNLSLRIKLDDRIVRNVPITQLSTDGESIALATLLISTPGAHVIEANIGPAGFDALSDDNARRLSIEVKEQVDVLLVDGRPGATALEGQTGYLATALAPRVSGDSKPLIRTKTISEIELSSEVLADYTHICLCNVQRLSESQWALLDRFVREGGAVIVFVGDLVSLENYNTLGSNNGQGLFPGKLAVPVDESADPNDYLMLDPEKLNHPIVNLFQGASESGLFVARFDRHLVLTPTHKSAQVVMRYTNGDPFLVHNPHDKGQVAVITTTANMDWTNLPAKGDFVSLMHSLMSYVSPAEYASRTLTVGQSYRRELRPAEQSMNHQVRLPSGATAMPELIPRNGGIDIGFGPVKSAGRYDLSIGTLVVPVVTNVDPADSDLSTTRRSALIELSRAGINIEEVQGRATLSVSTTNREIGSVLIYLVLLLLMFEQWLAMRFGSYRQKSIDSITASSTRIPNTARTR